MTAIRIGNLGLLLVTAGCLGACTARPAISSAASSHPTGFDTPTGRVLVTVVVDQLAAWLAAERLPLLPADGGFARLRREGTWAVDVRFAHAGTETAPGHAALYTGLPPRESGVYTNEIPGPDGEASALVLDESTRLVDIGGPTDRPGASPARLRVHNLADGLRERHPAALVVALSLKDRSTVLSAGRRPDAAVWFDHDHDVLVTSTAFADRLPAWALAAATSEAFAARRAAPWQPFDPAFLATHATADEAPGEGDYLGMGTTFPHAAAGARRPPRAFRATPAADELLVELALAALDAERRPGQPTLLALSFSTHDYVGHVFGLHSWEAWDELLRLDRQLATLLRGLDARFGPAGWSLLLSADHGAVPMPELAASARPWCAAGAPSDRWERPCAGGGRVNERHLADTVRAAAGETLGEGAWIAGLDDVLVFLTDAARTLPGAQRSRLDAAVRARLLRGPGIEEVFALPVAGGGTCPDGESLAALVCRSALTDDGAGYYLVLARGWAFETTMVPGKGTNHGSPWLYDRSVPLLARAPGRIPAGVVIERPLSYATFARTAATLLGLDGFGAAGTDLASARVDPRDTPPLATE